MLDYWHSWLEWIFSYSLVIKCYHPIIFFRRCRNRSPDSGFVKISAVCSVVPIEKILICPLLTNDLKWWYFSAICFVRGVMLGDVATLIQLVLSLKTLHLTIGGMSGMNSTCLNSSSMFIIGITSLIDCDSATYSDSVVLKAISVCSLLTQWIGHPT